MNDKTVEFISRRNEEHLKIQFVKMNMWSRIKTSNKCMLCKETAIHKYPIFLCEECFTLLYNPIHVEENRFLQFYNMYKSTNNVTQLKELLGHIMNHKDALYNNLKTGIMNKMKHEMSVNHIKTKIKLLSMQSEMMKNDYRKIVAQRDLEVIVSYKDSISRIKNELLLLNDLLCKVNRYGDTTSNDLE